MDVARTPDITFDGDPDVRDRGCHDVDDDDVDDAIDLSAVLRDCRDVLDYASHLVGRRTSSPPSSSARGGLRRRHTAVGDDARARRAIAIAGRSWGEGAATARGRAWARGGVVERGSEDGPPPPPPPPSGEDCAVGTPPSGTTPNDAAILGGLARMQKIRGARLTYRCHRSWGRARGRLFLIFLWLKDF